MKPLSSGLSTESNTNTDFQFSIKTSPHAFKILSDSLYSDKILAVVREYLTNALDAHRASQKLNTPIQITLPTVDQEWAVRDYGTGLSQEQIQTLFCTYFNSSKTDTNEQTGMLGLGCKSGFAYTHQFSVTSWFEGRETCYQIYLDEGVPSVSIIYTFKSSEPSGLKVSIPVKKEDTGRFIIETKNILSWFPKEIVPERLYQRDSNIINECDGFYEINTRSWKVLMGNVLYPMPREFQDYGYSLRSNFEKATQKNIIGWNGLVIKAPLGSLNVLPSREGLSLDTKTKENLKTLVKQCFEIQKEKVFSKIKEYKPKKRNKLITNLIQIYSGVSYRGIAKEKMTGTIHTSTSTSQKSFNSRYNLPVFSVNEPQYIILVNKKTKNKYSRYIKKWLKDTDNSQVCVIKYLGNPQKKRMHKYLKSLYTNKIFFSYEDFVKFIYPNGLPTLGKEPNNTTPKPKTIKSKKALSYLVRNILDGTEEHLTVKEILTKYPYDEDTYFVFNSYMQEGYKELLTGKRVFLVSNKLRRYLVYSVKVRETLRDLIDFIISEKHKKERLLSILLFSMNNFTSYKYLSKKYKGCNYIITQDRCSVRGYEYFSEYVNYLPTFTNDFKQLISRLYLAINPQFIFKYVQRKLRVFFNEIGFKELLILQNELENIEPVPLQLVVFKDKVPEFIKLLEGVVDDLLRFSDIAKNRSVPQ